MSEGEMSLGALLHRAGHVDQENNTTLPQPALAPAHADELAGVAHCLAKHPSRVGARPAARAPPSIAAAPRYAGRQFARETMERLVLACRREAAGREPLGAGR